MGENRDLFIKLRVKNGMFNGMIPIVGSDHAPHTTEDKEGENPTSGIISGTAWPYVLSHLK